MSKQVLSARTIHLLSSGRFEGSLDAAINSVLLDIDDRGSDEKERKIIITIGIGKTSAQSNDIYIDPSVKTTIPTYDAGSTVCRLKMEQVVPGGPLRPVAKFEPESPDNPDQPSMFDEERRRRRRHPEAPAEGETAE